MLAGASSFGMELLGKLVSVLSSEIDFLPITMLGICGLFGFMFSVALDAYYVAWY